jgi:hypothetical protein
MPTELTASTDFLLLRPEWSTRTARELVDQMEAGYVVARGPGPNCWRVWTQTKGLKLLDAIAEDEPVGSSPVFLNGPDIPTVEAGSDPDGWPDLCVVTEEDRLIGIHDAENSYRGVEVSRDLSMTYAGQTPEARSLEAVFPRRIGVGSSAKLVLTLTSEPGGLSSLGIDLPVGAEVEVVVQARGGLEVDGAGDGILTVSDDEMPPTLLFKILAKALGPARLRIFAFHNSCSLGKLDVAAQVVPIGGDGLETERTLSRPLGATVVGQPDLSLLIFENTQSGVTTFDIKLMAPGLGFNFKKYKPISFATDPSVYFRDIFDDIERLGKRRTDLPERLAARGCHLFEALLPADLQADLWNLRDRIESVQVQSEDPWIPWELLKLCGTTEEGFTEGPFLCEKYTLTRWVPGVSQKPLLSLSNMAVVVPGDSGLRFAAEELNDLIKLAGGERRVTKIPARFLQVRKALAQGVYDGFHFSGHGLADKGNPNRSSVRLEAGDEMSAEELCGVVANLGRARPLVFMNACQIGRTGMSLTDVGGWAFQFVRAGAGAFVGAYWSVYDRPAQRFAKAFYNCLLAGHSIGSAGREARAEIRADDDPTWLAYTVYADPAAAVGLGKEEPKEA